MTEAERRAWKARMRPTFEPFIRAQVAEAERLMGLPANQTRAERFEVIRKGIKDQAHAYRALVVGGFDDAQFALSLELFDEIIDSLKRATVS